MKVKNYHEIVFALEDYSWGKTDGEARATMWVDISNLLQILLKNQYAAVVRDDDVDVIVVEFEHDESKEFWGGVSPHWITEDDMDKIQNISE